MPWGFHAHALRARYGLLWESPGRRNQSTHTVEVPLGVMGEGMEKKWGENQKVNGAARGSRWMSRVEDRESGRTDSEREESEK